MAYSQRTKTIALIAAGVIGTLLLGGATGWLARGSEIDDLEEQVAALEDEMRELESSITSQTIEATASIEPTGTTSAVTEDPPATTTTEGTGDGAEGPPGGPTERQPGVVVEVTGTPGSNVLRVDYVLFLSGGEAADAAAAHGDESPPPNDYYIVNDNPRIRDFPIQPGIPVFVVTNNDGTSDADGHTITLDQWVAALSGPNASTFKAGLYWVTVTNGIVTAIEAQYLP